MRFLPLGTYYWRVKTRKANANDVWSEARSFELSEVDSEGDGLETVTVHPMQQGVWSMLGMYMGTETTGLASGLYIINGKKSIIP